MKKLVLTVVTVFGFLQISAQDCSMYSHKNTIPDGTTYNVVNKEITTFISLEDNVVSALLAGKENSNQLTMQFTVKDKKIAVYSFDKMFFLMKDKTKDFLVENQLSANYNSKIGAFFGGPFQKTEELNLLKTSQIETIVLKMSGESIRIRLTETQSLELMQAFNCILKK